MLRTRIEVQLDALPADVRVIRVLGSEAMSSLSRWDVDLLTQDAGVDLEGLLGQAATVGLLDELEGVTRTIALVVVEAAHQGRRRDGHVYSLVLAPVEWQLCLRAGHRIFLGKTTQEIVKTLLDEAGIPATAQVYRLAGRYQARVQCVQYGESQIAFVQRLLADEGIAYWFDYDEDHGPRIVFGDGAGSHEGLLHSPTLAYADQAGMVSGRHLRSMQVSVSMATAATHVREYDERRPDNLIEGKAGQGFLEYYEYPACVLDDAAAAARAQVRLEQLQRAQIVATAESDCVRLQPGRVVTVDGTSDAWIDSKYLVVAVEHEYSIGARGDAAGRAEEYSNVVRMVPFASTFRPELPRDVPRVAGVETAMTTGPAGEEIHVDDLGALKLLFPWDRAGITDDKSSAWARCMQLAMGGSMLIPRVGWEVPVVYVDGNPDRPFVLGRLYNASAVLPYGLPKTMASTSFQSATTPGGGSTNEIRMGDSGGSQDFFVHASKDQSVTVGGSADTTVGVDETHDVGLGLSVGIKSSQTLTVGAQQKINVTGDVSVGISGSRSETVGGMEMNKITANRTVDVGGAYTELIGALYGVQCNQANYTVKGAFTQLIGALHSTAAGLGFSENVAAARTELVGASRSITAAKAYGDNTTGAKSVTAGATTEKAGGKVVTDVKAAGKITAATANLTSSGDFNVKAPSITIEVSGTVKAEALELGGSFKVSSGSISIKGDIKRKGGSEVGG